ncbi:3-isopropylmalate dehydratase small subunit [Candidatus Altiarchaeales archaeon WOR_SM1_SCG]|nr:3-isopropylmalate dehydratase small subunit [Candidatus Altiarchaeales archaeon WOR_SM1_SCG]
MQEKIKGCAWKFKDDINTDDIIPAKYLVTADPKELAKHAFENTRPEFAKNVKPGDIIAAGYNFGCGSSREHAPRALMGAGISCVVAKSFARIFFRNSINIGLPLVECDIFAGDGDEVAVDFKEGTVKNLTKNKEFKFKSLPEFLLNLIESGGLVEYTKKELLKI